MAGCAAPSGGGGDDGGACTFEASSTLPGVSIRFTATTCRFTRAQAAAGIAIPYEVVIANDVPGVDPTYDPNSLSRDERPGPSGLAVFEYLWGTNGARYCYCDVGLPNPPMTAESTLVAGTYPGTFDWDGRNWYGPSDTGNPEGAPFPPGSYDLLVRATGTVNAGTGATPFDVHAVLHLTLTR